MTTWILVADAARARIFQKGGPGQKIAEVRSLVHPGSRQKTSELVSDRPGRLGKGGIGGARRSAMEADTSPHEAEANQFAAILAQTLEQGIDHKEYARLVMVAPPHFLGTLRAAVSGRVAEVVTETVNQDYTHLNEKDLSAALDRHLTAAAYA
jgi:protein required for attachment to host cells